MLHILLFFCAKSVMSVSCISWRQTSNCDPNGPREPFNNKGCNAVISSGDSGFCECANGKRAMAKGCSSAPYRNCLAACDAFDTEEDADCVLGSRATGAQCTSACGTVYQEIITPATGNGRCDPTGYDCRDGDGDCGSATPSMFGNNDGTCDDAIRKDSTCLSNAAQKTSCENVARHALSSYNDATDADACDCVQALSTCYGQLLPECEARQEELDTLMSHHGCISPVLMYVYIGVPVLFVCVVCSICVRRHQQQQRFRANRYNRGASPVVVSKTTAAVAVATPVPTNALSPTYTQSPTNPTMSYAQAPVNPAYSAYPQMSTAPPAAAPAYGAAAPAPAAYGAAAPPAYSAAASAAPAYGASCAPQPAAGMLTCASCGATQSYGQRYCGVCGAQC